MSNQSEKLQRRQEEMRKVVKDEVKKEVSLIAATNQFPNDPKKTIVDKIIQNPIYLILTILGTVFGALGGVPGCKSLFESPEFKYRGDNFVGQYMDDRSILLVGSVVNNGEEPLLIKGFRLKITNNGEITYADPRVLTDSTRFTGVADDSSRYMIKIKNIAAKDFQKLEELPPHRQKFGNILFTTPVTRDQLTDPNCLIELLCIDINDKVYRGKVENTPLDNNADFQFPKNELEFIPDTTK